MFGRQLRQQAEKSFKQKIGFWMIVYLFIEVRYGKIKVKWKSNIKQKKRKKSVKDKNKQNGKIKWNKTFKGWFSFKNRTKPKYTYTHTIAKKVTRQTQKKTSNKNNEQHPKASNWPRERERRHIRHFCNNKKRVLQNVKGHNYCNKTNEQQQVFSSPSKLLIR